MYLQQHLGENIALKLKRGISEQDTFRILHRDLSDIGLIIEKLIAVDELGVWIEGEGYMTEECDEDGNTIPIQERTRELVTAINLVRWEYIEGIFVLQKEMKSKKIGFSI